MARDHFKEASNALTRLQTQMVKAITGYYRLGDFIGALRASPTMAQERALIAKEALAIRTSLKEADLSLDQRYHAIAKLVLLQMMGHSGHYGQVEGMKLAASSRLADKRLGYYAATQLLDQWQPTLTLLTNSLQHDLASGEGQLQAQALVCLSVLANPELALELADEVARLLSSHLGVVGRKAALCAAQLVRTVPDLADTFAPLVAPLLAHPQHGVLLGGLSLLEALLLADPAQAPALATAHLPTLLRRLAAIQAGRSTSTTILPSTRYSNSTFPGSPYAAHQLDTAFDYEVHGVHDPFVQVKLLQLIRRLHPHAAAPSQATTMADTLTIILASVDPQRAAGQAVLVEAILTCLALDGHDGEEGGDLRALALSQLGRLLERSEEANLRYVVLNLLGRLLREEGENLTTGMLGPFYCLR